MVTPWKIWERVPQAQQIAAGLTAIPAHWSLTPLQDKAPRRNGWEDEPFIPHAKIAELILDGEEKISQKGKTYRAYQSGFGLRTGDVSGGLLAIDIDGPSAGELLSAIANSHIPKTVSFSSGKPGRCQLLFQIPEKLREQLKNFTRKPIREWNGQTADCDLDFRFNRVQSCLPPSRHPETGEYRWIHSPLDTPVALAPDWLCDLLIKLANTDEIESEAKKQATQQREREREQRRQQRQSLNIIGEVDLSDILERDILPRLSLDDIYNWSGHSFKKNGSKLVGYCPRHTSASGTAFQVNPTNLSWYCHGCAAGGHAIQYRHFVNGGNGTPTGKDFIQIVRSLALDAGVQLPEWKPNQRDRTPEPEPDAQQYAAYQQAEAERDRVERAEVEERDRHKQEQQHKWYQAYPDRVLREWLRLKSFTQFTTEIAQRFLGINPETDLLPGITGIKSGMGTGKTALLSEFVKQFPRGNVLSYRNGLLQNTTARIPGIDFIHDLEIKGESQLNKTYRNQSNWTAACVDSIGKLQPKKVLILEEAQKLINHLLRGQTCKRERAFILKRFEDFCQKAEYIILLDADLTDIELNYIQSLCPGKKVWGIQNTFIPWQWEIYWYAGSGSEKGSKPNDRKILESRILASLAAGEIPLIVSDSQQWLEAMQRLLESLYPFDGEVFRVDSYTKADDSERVNAFLAAPDTWLAANQPAAVMLSPTCESSLDISQKYFTHVYGMFAGNIDGFSARQMLGRYRQNVERHIFIKEFARKDDRPQNSPLPEVALKHLHQYERQTIEQIALAKYLRENAKDDPNFFDLLAALNEIVDFKTETWKDPHLKAWGDYQARDNYQKANLRKTLRELLEDAGHLIVSEVFGASEPNRVSAERKTILEERAAKISKSPDIDIEEARQIMQDMAATSAQRFAAEKAILKEKLPGVDLTPDFVYWCKYENSRVLGALQNHWMMQHPGCREHLDREAFQKALQYGTPVWDIHTRALELSVLRDLDLQKLEGCEFSSDSPEIRDFHSLAISHSKRIKLALGITVTAESDPIYLARRCFEKLGYEMRGKQVRRGEARVRVYTALPPESHQKSAAVLAAYDARYADLLAKVANSATQEQLSQTAYLREITSESQSVTNAELLALAISQEKNPATTWRGMLVMVRESLELSTEFERNRLAKLPFGQILQVSSEPYPGFFGPDDWRVWCDPPDGGSISVPCAWLEIAG